MTTCSLDAKPVAAGPDRSFCFWAIQCTGTILKKAPGSIDRHTPEGALCTPERVRRGERLVLAILHEHSQQRLAPVGASPVGIRARVAQRRAASAKQLSEMLSMNRVAQSACSSFVSRSGRCLQ